MDPVRIGILGAGGITALLHAPNLLKLGERVEVTCCKAAKSTGWRSLKRPLGAPRTTDDVATMLAADDLDAVIIATPHPLHVQPAIAALEAGKHLLLQKPLCGDLDEAHAFVAATEAHPDRVVMVLPHFSPEIVAAREILADGRLGTISGALSRHSHGGPEVYYAEVRDAFDEPHDDALWFFDAGQAAVGALFDMGVYSVARLVAMLGTVKEVIGATATLAKPTSLEDTATLLLTFENGALGTAETGWVDPARTAYWRVHGSRGKLWSPGPGGAALTLWRADQQHSRARAAAADRARSGAVRAGRVARPLVGLP